jgi:hypothetical protein
MKTTHLCFAAAIAASAPVLVAAQPAARAEPTTLTYPSAFADYKPYRDIEPGDWRRLNDVVGSAALKPGAQPAAAAASSAAAPARPAVPMDAPGTRPTPPGGHSAHGAMQGGKP